MERWDFEFLMTLRGTPWNPNLAAGEMAVYALPADMGHATQEKTVHTPVSFAPLSLTRLDSFPDPSLGPPATTESPRST